MRLYNLYVSFLGGGKGSIAGRSVRLQYEGVLLQGKGCMVAVSCGLAPCYTVRRMVL